MVQRNKGRVNGRTKICCSTGIVGVRMRWITVGLKTWNAADGTCFGWMRNDAQNGGYDAFATKYLTTAFFDLY